MNEDKFLKTVTAEVFKEEPFKPYVDDDGIYMPHMMDNRYGYMLISKELFVEAYNKWIKSDQWSDEDTADDWCE